MIGPGERTVICTVIRTVIRTSERTALRTSRVVVPVAIAFLTALAWGQPTLAPPAPTRASGAVVEDDLTGQRFDRASCMLAPPAPPPTDVTPPPATWRGFEVVGQLVDPLDTVRALFEPTMRRHRALTDAAREDIDRIAAAYGYHVVALSTREGAAGTIAVLNLARLPMVRRVEVDVPQSLFGALLDDEVRRRMRVRVGGYLPWAPKDRACELFEEKLRIQEFLRDEGYMEARVAIRQERKDDGIATKVKVALGPAYTTGVIRIGPRDPSGITDDEIRARFHHQGNCLIWELVCVGGARFKRSEHQADIQKVVELFQQRGFPAVRVRTDFDPLTSFDRRTKTVSFTVTVDPRRQLEVVFEGHDPAAISTETLLKQLTFNAAASSDDVEANESARALTAHLQGRGYFDARVTWTRERFEQFDRVVYRIEQGEPRPVRSVEFVGNHALSAATLAATIGTREARMSASLLGQSAAATSAQLAADVDAIAAAYRRAGYREARVRVDAATDPSGLGSRALAAALVLAERGTGLFIRFTINEGLPTLLTRIHVSLGEAGDAIATPEDRALCELALAELATVHEAPPLARPAIDGRCVAVAPNLAFREAAALEARDRLRDRLYSAGRPRATVTYEQRALGPRRVVAQYTLRDVQPLTIGKVVIRGNFRTVESIIRDQLRLGEGQLLSSDALAEGARRLRSTGLFDAVNVAFPDLENVSAGSVNAVVEVTERYDVRGQLAFETGYSSYNGAFIKAIPSLDNLFGRGISLDLEGAIGFDLGELIDQGDLELRQLGGEANLRLPQFWVAQWFPIEFQAQLTGFHRQQDTPRFGELTTTGTTVALSRSWQRPRITLGSHYDFRLRQRAIDVLRPAGADDDQPQVPISTRTGSVGLTFEWEQRVDRDGKLSPLAPERGFRLAALASYASPYLGGQDTFIKVSASGSKFWSPRSNLVLRADVRYDQGFPLNGAVLLPEVERFFAGGDSTVRGYDDDRLDTEILQVDVPPFDNLQQIRILPAGGNIRVLSSFDAQLRIVSVIAAAAFVDAGMITNAWSTVTEDDLRPAVGAAVRVISSFGALAVERAIPLNPQLGDDPRGRWHLSFAARAQF